MVYSDDHHVIRLSVLVVGVIGMGVLGIDGPANDRLHGSCNGQPQRM